MFWATPSSISESSHSHRPEELLPCHGAGILASHEQPALDTHPSIRTSEASP
jgi:hypothetical protein